MTSVNTATAGLRAFAAGYLVVLLIGPLAGCAFGAFGAGGARLRRVLAGRG